MIARSDCRRQGLGKEAVLLMMRYAVTELKMKQFQVKIGRKNEASLHLFQHYFGFHCISVSEVFDEITLGRSLDDILMDALMHVTYSVKSFAT